MERDIKLVGNIRDKNRILQNMLNLKFNLTLQVRSTSNSATKFW